MKKQLCFLMILLFVLASFLTGCAGADRFTPVPDEVDPVKVKLSYYNSCSDLLGDIQNNMIVQMEAVFDSYRCDAGDVYSYGDGDVGVGIEVSAEADSASDLSSTSFTDTNLQEQGVDEADIIKTDGEYIYVATTEGIDVFKAWPFDEFSLKVTVSLGGQPSVLYLSDNQMIAVETNSYEPYNVPTTKIHFIDVSNPEAPIVTQTKLVRGDYSNSRLVDSVLHVAVNVGSVPIEYEYPVDLWSAKSDACWSGDSNSTSESYLASLIESAKQTNKEKIMALSLEDVLPFYGNSDDLRTVDCSSIASDDVTSEVNFAGLYSVEVGVNDPNEKITYVKGRAHNLYGATTAMYFAASDIQNDATYFHRFEINSASLHNYFGSGSVAGTVYNSFAMSEYEGVFRIATTQNNNWSSGQEMTNNVYTIDATDPEMPELGRIFGIAPQEKIYAVRFKGPIGYVVTFETFDPLFVIDLSDPTNPQIKGELEMPGYSTYLHNLNDEVLIGFGEYVTDFGGFLEHDGLKLATFNVGNLSNPTIIEEERIGSGWSMSAAFSDHLAFTFDNETNTLVLPVELYDNSADTSGWSGEFQYYGVWVFELSESGEITVVKELALEDGTGGVKRSLIMSDDESQVLYILSNGALYLYDMDGYELIGQEEVNLGGYCYVDGIEI